MISYLVLFYKKWSFVRCLTTWSGGGGCGLNKSPNLKDLAIYKICSYFKLYSSLLTKKETISDCPLKLEQPKNFGSANSPQRTPYLMSISVQNKAPARRTIREFCGPIFSVVTGDPGPLDPTTNENADVSHGHNADMRVVQNVGLFVQLYLC